MNELIFFGSLSFYSAIAIYLLWFICQYNGKIILYFIQSISGKKNNSKEISSDYSNVLGEHTPLVTACLVGTMPLAVLSIATARLNTCFNSLYATITLEIVVTIFFLFIPQQIKKQWDIFGIKLLRKNSGIVFYTGLWCLIFALWATTNHHESLDYMISNSNPDMWAYVRRFGAMTTDNLYFHGGLDSFTFENYSACAYLLGSPKKFSSFLGSLFIYPLQGSSLAIAVFQGMLGGILFICLFKEWFKVQFSNKKKFSFGKFILMTWALFSPPIYWLMISAYFSNALFLVVVCLTLRQGRQIAIKSQIDTIENLVCFFAILTIVFAFYPAFLPVIIFTYAVVILVYLPRNYFQFSKLTKIIVKYLGIIISCGLIFYFLFPSQLGLDEIQKSLNVLTKHGSNFVPLNPWSLLQEKPKPMALQRDFGWYFNIIISLPFNLFLGWKIWQKYKQTSDTIARHDLLAGLAGVSIYSGYLLAYIPLEHTYRLMKIAISLVYPLAIFGLLPFILWSKQKLSHKSPWLRNGILVLAIAHAVFHIHKTFDLNSTPSGNFTLNHPEKLEDLENISIVACPDVHSSQFYERLVGLNIARRYPNLEVNVVKFPELLEDIPNKNMIVYGETIIEEKTNKKTCHFSI